jgi:hypothetical protein
MLGANLADLDKATLALLNNDEVIAINQDLLGQSARRATAVGTAPVARWPSAFSTERRIHWWRMFRGGIKILSFHQASAICGRTVLPGHSRFRD